uniref:SH2 domain-containing protein n=1 Tax=Neolamprologus brichardi TaxID=32507 RepID=A0A3Q4I2L7_NEOBR
MVLFQALLLSNGTDGSYLLRNSNEGSDSVAMCLVLMSFQPFKTLSTTSLTNLCWAATQVCRP